MKKKTLEKVPYLGLPEVKRGRGARYVGVTALLDVAGQEHFFLEVYRNRRDSRAVPVARIVVTENDFGTYFPDSREWSGQVCADGDWHIWDRGHTDGKGTAILYSPEDRNRLEAYFTGIPVYDREKWWEPVRCGQKNIARERRGARKAKRNLRRQQALQERAAATPELPEASVLEYADRKIFRNQHFLYYRKHGSRAEMACSACGRVSWGRWKRGEAYESQFESTVQEPRGNHYGTCPLCGAAGKYVPQGRARSVHKKKGYLFLGQRFRETGMVFRYMEVYKEYRLEILGAGEGLCVTEVARAYFEKGKKMQTDYHKWDPMEGKDFWDDCNLSGPANITVKEAPVMPETYGNMQGTFLQYSALREYQETERVVNPFRYMDRYMHTPQIEMLAKTGLTGVVKELLGYRYGIVADEGAACAEGFLGIRKEKVRYLIKNRGSIPLLMLLQEEKRLGQRWTEEQTEHLMETGLGRHGLGTALEHMTVQKLLNRIERYAGAEFGTGMACACNRLAQTAQLYIDYLGMRQKCGYDLDNTVYQQPRDLRAAHDRMVYESSREDMDRRMGEAADRFPLIRKHYRRLRKKYCYQDETYLVRPARSAEEIVAEGRILHHCVGGDHYLDRHNRGESFILMLRFRKDPETPYITVEIGRDGKIRQWYGAHDRKPDGETMQKWLDAYVLRLKCSGPAAGQDGTAGMLDVTA